jgi:hypothetical protein
MKRNQPLGATVDILSLISAISASVFFPLRHPEFGAFIG